jgi:hypothetical protein
VALRGAEAVEWSAVLPSRKLAGSLKTHPRHRYGATKLALEPIASPEDHPVAALSDAVIALAGVRAQRFHGPTNRVRVSPEDRAIVRNVWHAFPGGSTRAERAFRRWLHVLAEEAVFANWRAVACVAKILDERNEILGREIAAEVAAARVAEAR